MHSDKSVYTNHKDSYILCARRKAETDDQNRCAEAAGKTWLDASREGMHTRHEKDSAVTHKGRQIACYCLNPFPSSFGIEKENSKCSPSPLRALLIRVTAQYCDSFCYTWVPNIQFGNS